MYVALLTHVVYFAPLALVCRSSCDTAEAGKEPLHEGVGGRFLNYLAAACGGAESEVVFHSGQIRSVDSFPQEVFPDHGFVRRA